MLTFVTGGCLDCNYLQSMANKGHGNRKTHQIKATTSAGQHNKCVCKHVTFLAMSTTPQKPVLTEAAALPVELLTALVALLVLVLAACVGWCLKSKWALCLHNLLPRPLPRSWPPPRPSSPWRPRRLLPSSRTPPWWQPPSWPRPPQQRRSLTL